MVFKEQPYSVITMLPYSSLCTVAALLFALSCSINVGKTATALEQILRPDCPSTCGNLTIPYPFGIGESCARRGFHLSCNTSSTGSQKAFLGDGTIEVQNISLLQGQVSARYYLAYDCYDKDGIRKNLTYWAFAGKNYPYTFSSLQNKFTAIGCDNLAYIVGSNDSDFTGGCVSVCSRPDTVVYGSCSGIGCCQTDIPKGLKYYKIELRSYYKHSKVWNFNPCSYAFVADKDWFAFKTGDLSKDSRYMSMESVPVVLDWSAGEESCDAAKRDPANFACRGQNSHCYDSNSSAVGYLCNCSVGYEGNPYLKDGCVDINECQRTEEYPCNGECVNTPGSYTCKCPKGTNGDGRSGCTREMSKMVILALVLLALFVSALIICLYGIFEKRKREIAHQLYKQNGGAILEAHLSTCEHIQNRFKIFTVEELEKATNKFDDGLVLGHGGQGKVYKGTLPDGTNIAIKKPVQINNSRKGDFINEIIILTEINHPNVVKLIGCCLEVDTPFLVYEFMSNKTLSHHINKRQLSWEKRLRIAASAAGALAHLHGHAPHPIYHQDVKSANILHTTDYTAKNSDFGISKLVSNDARAISTLVEGTIGYLDPEYIVSRELTGKSDVFSFGVVLAELLTGKLAVSAQQSETKPLAKLFKSSVEENKVLDILDPQIAEEATDAAIADVMHVAELAGQCLNLSGKDRPDMMVVFIKLEGLWRSGYHRPIEDDRGEETNSLPANQIPDVQSEESSLLFDHTTVHSVNAFDIESGR